MKGVMPQVFVGPDALDDVVRAVEAGLPEGLVIAGPDADALATASRDLVRRLRTDNGQVEFYEPGGTEGLLQATNRLLQDIPLEQLSSSRVSDGMRLLLVLNAEAMGREEAATIRRLAGALRGSALRILLFARLGTVIELHPTLAEFAEAGTCWLLDEKTARRVEVAGIDEVAVAMPPATPPPAAAPATSGQNSPPVPPIVAPPKPVVAAVAKQQDDVDILMQLGDVVARRARRDGGCRLCRVGRLGRAAHRPANVRLRHPRGSGVGTGLAKETRGGRADQGRGPRWDVPFVCRSDDGCGIDGTVARQSLERRCVQGGADIRRSADTDEVKPMELQR